MQMAKRETLAAKLKAGRQDPVVEEEVMKQLEKIKIKSFHYSHQGSLACVFSLHSRLRTLSLRASIDILARTKPLLTCRYPTEM
jgi:hypothetical protein